MRLAAIIDENTGVDTQIIKLEIYPNDIIEAIKLECTEDVVCITVTSLNDIPSAISERCADDLTWIDSVYKNADKKIKSIYSIGIEQYCGIGYNIEVVAIYEDEDTEE